MEEQPVSVVDPIDPEDRLRADFYALFARLYLEYPDQQLLRMIGNAPLLDTQASEAPLPIAWERLSAGARVMDAAAAADEFEALFGGIGKSLVPLFGSHYVGENAPDAGGHFLVELREALRDLGVGLQAGQNVPEDHPSALFETMRLLIAGNESADPRDVETQRTFFRRFIAPWYDSCCSAIAETSLANFYRLVAECTSAFLAVEKESFEMA
jgi:TorA maturation chaperone TorD